MSRKLTILLATAALATAALAFAALAGAGKGMRSTELGNKLCKTSGGGRFVAIPGFPGERIDRRLVADVRWMKQRWDIFVTDGYSDDPVHSLSGEHPLGLALDIVPNKAAGGTWKKIDRLAAWAEPSQDQPRSPFRWVGYDGDAGHGHGHHLHISWSHSESSPFTPARTVYSVNCPGSKARDGGGGGNGGNGGGSGGNDHGGGGVGSGGGKNDGHGSGGGKGDGGKGNGGGGVNPGSGGGGGGNGGINPRSAQRQIQRGQASGSSVETGGVELP